MASFGDLCEFDTVTTTADRTPSVSWAVSSDRQPEAFDIYRDSFADICDVRDVADGGRNGFHSRTQAHMFGPMLLARADSSRQTLARTNDHIRRSGIDHINIVVNLGETTGDCNGRDVHGAPGSILFRDLSKPSAAHMSRIDMVTLMAPRAAVPRWLLDQNVHGLVLPGDSAGGRLVASHLRTLAAVAGDLTEAQGLAAIEATFVIAERFLGRSRPIAPRHLDAIHRGIREQVMSLIDAQPPQARWTAEGLARAVGVSRTSLYRAFEASGGVRAYVLHRRLSRAFAGLRGRSGATPTVEAIGLAHGFSDRKSFAQAFRARFGLDPHEVSPSDHFTRVGQDGLADRALHDVITDWMRSGEVV